MSNQTWDAAKQTTDARCARCDEKDGLKAVEWTDGHVEPRCEEHAESITEQTDKAEIASDWSEYEVD